MPTGSYLPVQSLGHMAKMAMFCNGRLACQEQCAKVLQAMDSLVKTVEAASTIFQTTLPVQLSLSASPLHLRKFAQARRLSALAFMH